jgi:hypothetical protein
MGFRLATITFITYCCAIASAKAAPPEDAASALEGNTSEPAPSVAGSSLLDDDLDRLRRYWSWVEPRLLPWSVDSDVVAIGGDGAALESRTRLTRSWFTSPDVGGSLSATYQERDVRDAASVELPAHTQVVSIIAAAWTRVSARWTIAGAAGPIMDVYDQDWRGHATGGVGGALGSVALGERWRMGLGLAALVTAEQTAVVPMISADARLAAQWRLHVALSDARLDYRPTRPLLFQIVLRPSRFNLPSDSEAAGTMRRYQDLRLTLGASWAASRAVTLHVSSGIALQRTIDGIAGAPNQALSPAALAALGMTLRW